MLMNLGFAGSGAAAPINTVVPTGSGSFVAIYRARHIWILAPFLGLVKIPWQITRSSMPERAAIPSATSIAPASKRKSLRWI
jgi:hypothetical protein